MTFKDKGFGPDELFAEDSRYEEFNLLTEFADTPIEEREVERMYNLTATGFHLNPEKVYLTRKIDDDVLLFSSVSGNSRNYRAAFSKIEIMTELPDWCAGLVWEEVTPEVTR